ncbi:tyrosine-type recombinase/integrase [Actinosynnema sp. NPDC020468]|uniref:tyrosine-type recombinase/integrase n=1 Tax=Actinosynnema sp. NPDC020468 TaxID=3154488 RepID=UPI0033D7BC8C
MAATAEHGLAGGAAQQFPPSIAVIYETLRDSRRGSFVFTSPATWDGRDPGGRGGVDHVPPILPWLTFHEGRHSHSTWMIEDGIPEVARRARLGHKMKGIARIYDHVTSVMLDQLDEALEARWRSSLLTLQDDELTAVVGRFPHLGQTVADARALPSHRPIAIFSPLILPNTQEARPQDRVPGF